MSFEEQKQDIIDKIQKIILPEISKIEDVNIKSDLQDNIGFYITRLIDELTPPKPHIVVKELSRSDQDSLLGFDWLNYSDDTAARKAYQELFKKIVLDNVTIEE